jgi:hypothetical protein
MKISDKNARMTPQDITVLKAMFEEREGAVEVIRKIFFPELTADNPIFANKDMWSNSLSLDGLSPEQAVIEIKAHQKLINHVEGCLSIVKQLIGEKNETAEQVLERLQKNSSK